jgi:SAM-dependent methyltransferase
MAGWPFWAATSDERIDFAFDLAELRAGEHLVDLGCGDGRVLLRAGALRGARVTGIELDSALAASARTLLTEHAVAGEVVEADFADAPLGDVDVVFAYLSPATLQRLRPKLDDGLPDGARVVTTGYAVPGWVPDEAGNRCYLYRRPFAPTDVDRTKRGWDGAGVLVSVRPDAPSLVAVKLHAEGGQLRVRVADGALAQAMAVRAGADETAPGDEVVVDLRLDPRPEATVLAGSLEAVGASAPPFQVFAVVDHGEPGVWGLSAAGCDSVGTALANGDVASVLEDARGS